MRDLKTLRERWADIQREEAKLSPASTVQERVRRFFILYQTFAPQLEETEAVFGPARRAHLTDLQRKLQRVAEWQQAHGKVSHKPENDVKNSNECTT